MGVLFAGTFAFGVLLFSTIDGYAGDLLGYLLGNVLGISAGRPLQAGVLGVACWSSSACSARSCSTPPSTRSARPRRGCPWARLEYLLLGLLGVTIVVSIQAVGIILVVAMLVRRPPPHSCS